MALCDLLDEWDSENYHIFIFWLRNITARQKRPVDSSHRELTLAENQGQNVIVERERKQTLEIDVRERMWKEIQKNV